MTIWEGYNNYVYKLHLILERASREVGIPVNDTKRINLKDDLELILKRLDEELQKLVPIEIRDLSPRRKIKETGKIEYGFKRKPKEILALELGYNNAVSRVLREDPDKKVLPLADFIFKKTGMVYWFNDDENKNYIARVKSFKPSSQQIIKYLRWKGETLSKSSEKEERKLAKSYKIPINFKTKKPTSGKKELDELLEKTGDEVLKSVQEFRSIKYNLSNSIPNWKPDASGYCHTTWGFIAPTGQLDSRNPNILNCSKHTTVGKVFRKIVEVPDLSEDGDYFVEFDFKSFHVGLMGFRANDRSYIRFSQLDPHSIFCSHIIVGDSDIIPLIPHLHDWSDDQIMALCRIIKSRYKGIRQEQAKPTVLGNQLGLGPFKLQHQNRKFIPTVSRARELQEILRVEFPKVEQAKRDVTDEADVKGYLKNEFGRIQYFFDVYTNTFNKKENKWEKKHGTDYEKCLAFSVQSPAFGMIHEKLLRLEEGGWLERFRFNNSIHDQVAFMPRGRRDRDLCLEVVGKELQGPCSMLVNEATGSEGLAIGVEASVGRNWGDKNEENPMGMEEVSLK